MRIIFTFAAIIALLVLGPLESPIRLHAPEYIYRLYAGFYLSIISTTAFAVFVRTVRSLRRGTILEDIEPNKWMRPFSLMMMMFLFIFAAVIWYVSWEGANTGVWYGIGFLLGGALTEAGVGRMIKSEE